MIKKIGIIVLFALIIIPSAVMAAGCQQVRQQAENSQIAEGQEKSCSRAVFEISNAKGNGDTLRIRNCIMDCDQSGDQLRNITRTQSRLTDGSSGNCLNR